MAYLPPEPDPGLLVPQSENVEEVLESLRVVRASKEGRLVILEVLVGLVRVVHAVALLSPGRTQVGLSGEGLVYGELIRGRG